MKFRVFRVPLLFSGFSGFSGSRINPARHVTSYHVRSRHVTSCHGMTRHVTPCHAMSRHVMSRHITSRHGMSCHVMPCRVMSHHALGHVMSCRILQLVILCQIASYLRPHTMSCLGPCRVIMYAAFVISCHVMSHLVSYHVTSRVVSYHATSQAAPCQVISCHISRHFMPCCAMSDQDSPARQLADNSDDHDGD